MARSTGISKDIFHLPPPLSFSRLLSSPWIIAISMFFLRKFLFIRISGFRSKRAFISCRFASHFPFSTSHDGSVLRKLLQILRRRFHSLKKFLCSFRTFKGNWTKPSILMLEDVVVRPRIFMRSWKNCRCFRSFNYACKMCISINIRSCCYYLCYYFFCSWQFRFSRSILLLSITTICTRAAFTIRRYRQTVNNNDQIH